MAEKVILNIVYKPQVGPSHKVFENEKGEIWHSQTKDPNKINIGMGWYSIQKPAPDDSILVVEPFCVLERDYDPGFTKKFKHIFTWAIKGFTHRAVESKVVEIIHPTYHNFPDNETIEQGWPDWDKRSNEIIFVANNKSSKHFSELYSLRLLLADILDVRSKFDVSWYGQIPIKRKYYKGALPDKHSKLQSVKFSVCTENSYHPNYTYNYFTEKMPDAWKAGAVPLYMGCHNVDDFNFPKESYIDLREYCKKDHKRWVIDKQGLIDKIENYSEQEYNTYREKLKSEIFMSNKFHDRTAFKNAFEKMIDTFYQA